MKKLIIVSAFACFLIVPTPAILADSDNQTQSQNQEGIYGSQLMTAEERNEYRKKIRSAKTAKEREQIRNEHHQLMLKRAKQQGVTIPDKPPAMGAHRGMQSEGAMRPRGGMGPGGGQGR